MDIYYYLEMLMALCSPSSRWLMLTPYEQLQELFLKLSIPIMYFIYAVCNIYVWRSGGFRGASAWFLISKAGVFLTCGISGYLLVLLVTLDADNANLESIYLATHWALFCSMFMVLFIEFKMGMLRRIYAADRIAIQLEAYSRMHGDPPCSGGIAGVG